MLPYGRNFLRQNMLATHSIEETLKRLRDDREQADRLYNSTLSALNDAVQQFPVRPGSPVPYDEHQINPLNTRWSVVPPEPLAGLPQKGLRGRLYAAVWRLVGPLFQRQQEFNSVVVDHLNRNVQHHRDLQQALTQLVDLLRYQLMPYLVQVTLYVDTRDRDVAGIRLPLAAGISAVGDELHKRWEAIGVLQQATMSMKRELERVAGNGQPGAGGHDAGPPRPVDDYKYVGFEDRYRGSREAVREKLAPYVPIFQGAANVLDIGCGRGEFLELLKEQRIGARGIDLNRDMIELCRAAGLQVEGADALAYLQQLPDASLGGVFSSQLIEHLEPAYLMRFLETIFHKLKPGGKIVLETINPASWAAFFSAYIRDLTHAQPIHPETLSYLASASGFSNVEIRYSAPFAEGEKLQLAPAPGGNSELASTIATYNANVERLNGLLFTFRDYAVIAERAGTP